jgi:uncharacterized protein
MIREQIAGVWFEWDELKSARCHRERGLTFGVAAQVFFDEHALISSNMWWKGEERFHIIGRISPFDLVFVIFVLRKKDEQESYRIISARRAIASEETEYWEQY